MPKANNFKVCSICGKSESTHWARHWKNKHSTASVRELLPGETPSNPYDESWLYLIKPLTLRELFMTAAKAKEVQTNDTQLENKH